MEFDSVLGWLKQGGRRTRLVVGLPQPLTVKQLSHRLNMDLDACSYVVCELVLHALLRCLNHRAQRNRIYWLTRLGQICQRLLRQSQGLPLFTYDFPCVDWDVYGWVCFNQRAAVVRALSEPMQPVTIKKRARQQDPKLRMSANNVRDIIRLFLARGVVRRIWVRKKAHPRYELTESGQQMRTLLLHAQ